MVKNYRIRIRIAYTDRIAGGINEVFTTVRNYGSNQKQAETDYKLYSISDFFDSVDEDDYIFDEAKIWLETVVLSGVNKREVIESKWRALE